MMLFNHVFSNDFLCVAPLYQWCHWSWLISREKLIISFKMRLFALYEKKNPSLVVFWYQIILNSSSKMWLTSPEARLITICWTRLILFDIRRKLMTDPLCINLYSQLHKSSIISVINLLLTLKCLIHAAYGTIFLVCVGDGAEGE